MKKTALSVVMFSLVGILSTFAKAGEKEPFNPFANISMKNDYLWDLNCLALNIYHESRGEPLLGQLAIAFTVKERVKSPRWKNDVCGVVYSYKQWSWTKDHIPDYVLDRRAFDKALVVADLALKGEIANPVKGANHVYSTKVFKGSKKPWWAKDMKIIKRIANQVFLKG